jgi:hypothetical protein
MAFLGVIQLRPGMFLGDLSVRTLRTYIQAYSQARRDLGVAPYGADEDLLIPLFEEWLAVKGRNEGTAAKLDWVGYIEAIDNSQHNVMTFFRLFREFLAQRGQALDDPDTAWRDWPKDRSGFLLR